MGTKDSIRVASEDDVAAVLHIDRASPVDHERAAYLAARVAASECIVAERSGSVVGYLVLRERHFFGRDFIDLVVVLPDARRTGIARALLADAVGRAPTERVFTSTNRSNEPMRTLLAREGWSYAGSIEGLDVGDPELVFFVDRA